MLPGVSLDNENFEDIMEEARGRIASLCQEWTDYNCHDPGITLLELFSWLKESQQFYMDQVSGEIREKFLKLLGISRLTKRAARCLVQASPPQDVTVLPGTRLFAGDICFETEVGKQLVAGDVACCLAVGAGGLLGQADNERLRLGQGMGFPLFGASPQAGNCFFAGFAHGLPVGVKLALYLEIFDGRRVRRSPAEGGMAFLLARFSLAYFAAGGWREAGDLADETAGGVFSGFLRFSLDKDMEETIVFGQRGFFIRLYLEEEEYDAAPLLDGISINCIETVQRETLVEQVDVELIRGGDGDCRCQTNTMLALDGHSSLYAKGERGFSRVSRFTKQPDFDTGVTTFRFELPPGAEGAQRVRIVSVAEGWEEKGILAEGNGFPCQEYCFHDTMIEWESVGIMVREESGLYFPWERVADFSGSGPESRDFCFDSRTGTVHFGDCFRGMAPDGEIILVSLARTLGKKGNIKACKIDHFEGMEPGEMQVYNSRDCGGGRDEEELAESFLRAVRELAHPFLMVSDADYERCVMETPGLLLENCHVIPAKAMRRLKGQVDETQVYLVVHPFSEEGEKPLGRRYQQNILAWLEKRRMVGHKFCLLQPQYVRFEIYADIVLLSYYARGREMVRNAVEEYFSSIRGSFGAQVQHSELYGRIDMLECVARVNSLGMDARGTGLQRGKDGSVLLPPNGLARLGEARYTFGTGE